MVAVSLKKKFRYEILVVDDGSTDRTAWIVQQFARQCWQCPVRLVQHPQRRGAGAARKTGIRQARGHLVVMLDADGSYPASAIPELLKHFPHYDQVNGARTSEQGRWRWLRRGAKWAIRRLACYLTGTHIPDLNTGMKAFRRDEMLRWLWVMPDGFSARFSARWRRYRYRVGLRDDLFQRRYRWFPGRTPDPDALAAAAAQVIGTHDFTSFCKAASLRDDNTCCVTHSRWERRGDEAVYTVQADRFLHHMVRNLVGTMVEMASGRRPGRDLAEILAARDRAAAGTMAPPHGLYLAAVGYDEIDGSDTANDHPSPEERA